MDISTETIEQAQPSLEAYQVAMQYPMGGLIAEHKKRQPTQKGKLARHIGLPFLIFLYFCMIGLLIFISVLAIDNRDSLLQFSASSFINALMSIGDTLLILVAYGLFIALPLSFYLNRNPLILRCTEGLIYRRGGRTITMRWDEIESVSESIWTILHNTSEQSYTCTLRLYAKKYIFNRNVENANELGRAIEREITRHRIASYWQQIEQGEKLKFGPLSLDQQGIYKGSDMIPWDQISQVHIFEGVVAITKDSIAQKWPLVRVARIPNFFLFVALLHLLTNGRVSYEPLEFEFRDYFVEFIRLLFSRKAHSE